MMAGESGATAPYHAILLDIDHSPVRVLHPSHAAFYTEAGLRQLAGHLHPAGVFALWSDDLPDEAFSALLASVFTNVDTHVIEFHNAQNMNFTNTIYVTS